MTSASTPRIYRRGLDLYLACIGLMTVLYGLYTARFSRSWAISDWLINYEGGFVRRGLPGQVAYGLGHLLHVSPVFFVIVFCLTLYGVVLVSVRVLAARSSWSWWVIALLVSPATLAFPILDLSGGFRKELIYLASLALFLVLLERGMLSTKGAAAYMAAAVVVGTLSHEPLICFEPYFLAALLLAGRSPIQVLRMCLPAAALGVVAAGLAATHLGDLHTAQQICSSLGYQLLPPGREICSGGAIAYLSYTTASAREEVHAAIFGRHYLRLYPWLAMLALMPAVAGSFALVHAGMARKVAWLWGSATIALAGSMILFLYAEDWGRWISIHMVSLMLLLIFLDGRRSVAQVADVPMTTGRRVLAGVLLVLYATCWTLPCATGPEQYFGYGGLLRHMAARRHAGGTAQP